jgi:DNA-binding NtrC family response regulator
MRINPFPVIDLLSQPRTMTAKRSSPARILVAEDDISIRFLCTKALVHSGYGVDAAADGAAAWELLHRDRFDLLITDNDMPRLTGIELLKKVHSVRMPLSAIMATGSPPYHEFVQAPWLRPKAILLKPYSIEDLLQLVKEVLLAAEAVLQEPPDNAKPEADNLTG